MNLHSYAFVLTIFCGPCYQMNGVKRVNLEGICDISSPPINLHAGYLIVLACEGTGYTQTKGSGTTSEVDELNLLQSLVSSSYVDGCIPYFHMGRKHQFVSFGLKKDEKVVALGSFLIHHGYIKCDKAWQPFEGAGTGVTSNDVAVREPIVIGEMCEAGRDLTNHRKLINRASRRTMSMGAGMGGSLDE